MVRGGPPLRRPFQVADLQTGSLQVPPTEFTSLLEDLRAAAIRLALAAVDHRPLAGAGGLDRCYHIPGCDWSDGVPSPRGRPPLRGASPAGRSTAASRSSPRRSWHPSRKGPTGSRPKRPLITPQAASAPPPVPVRPSPARPFARGAGRALSPSQSLRSCSEICRYFAALTAWLRIVLNYASTSSTISVNRETFWSTRSILRSASTFRDLKRLMPAASSKTIRRAETFACRIWSTRPCSMMQ